MNGKNLYGHWLNVYGGSLYINQWLVEKLYIYTPGESATDKNAGEVPNFIRIFTKNLRVLFRKLNRAIPTAYSCLLTYTK